LGGGLAPQLSHYRRFEITDEELGHWKQLISMIAFVNQRSPASLKL
jgi:hypothetical protein